MGSMGVLGRDMVNKVNVALNPASRVRRHRAPGVRQHTQQYLIDPSVDLNHASEVPIRTIEVELSNRLTSE